MHGNYYGTSLKPIIRSINEGKLVIFDIDVQGHRIVKQKLNDITTSVFITTPTLSELKNRLTSRGTDEIKVIEKRISNAKNEIKDIGKYDYLIVNDDLEKASQQLVAVAKISQMNIKLFDTQQIETIWNS